MKPAAKLFITILIIALFFLSLHIFLIFKGKAILSDKLQQMTHKKTTIGYLGLISPFKVEIEKLNIEGLFKADRIYLSPSIIGLLAGDIAFNDIRVINPELTYEREVELPPPGEASSPVTVSAPATAPPPAAPLKETGLLHLALKHVNIRNGRINFLDHAVGNSGIRLVVKDLNFNLNNLYFLPRSAVTEFKLSGRIPWQEGQEEGKINAEGWFNLYKKDMQANFAVEDIDGIYLYPYYSTWVDLEKARIEKAKLKFLGKIKGLDNNITADCHLELTDIVRKPRPADEPQDKAEKITDAVLDIFRSLNQGKIVLDFSIRTKMSRPEFGFGNIKMAFEDKLVQGRGGFKAQDLIVIPGRLLQGTLKSVNDISRAVIDGTFAVGNEIWKTVENTFKRDKKPL